MPTEDAILCQSLAMLFRRPTDNDLLRPTELMYRCWHLFEDNQLPGSQGVLERFRSEFSEWCDLTKHRNDEMHSDFKRAPGLIARELRDSFVLCPPEDFEHPTDPDRDPCVFWMGSAEDVGDESERPRHQIRITPFMLQRTPVTREQYLLFDPALERSTTSSGWTDESIKSLMKQYSPDNACPIILASWHDAFLFAKWLGPQFRLPTETEWEFAARGGRDAANEHFGVAWSDQAGEHYDTLHTSQANFDPNSTLYQQVFKKDDPYCAPGDHSSRVGKTIPVTLPPNAENMFKLLGMHGNVWEWCQDEYDTDAYRRRVCKRLAADLDLSINEERWLFNGIHIDKLVTIVLETIIDAKDAVPPVGSLRMLRGGSWDGFAGRCRSASRAGGTLGGRGGAVGFRLCRELRSPESSVTPDVGSAPPKRGTHARPVPRGRQVCSLCTRPDHCQESSQRSGDGAEAETAGGGW